MKTKLVCQENAKLAATNSKMCAQLARFTTDLQQRRREVARLNSTCASHRHRIAALVSSNSTSSQPSADTVIATDIDSPSTETSTSRPLPLSAQFSGAGASTKSTSIASPAESRPLDKSSAAAAITETVVASQNDSSLSSSLSRQKLEFFLNTSIQDLTKFPRPFSDTESFCGINTRDWTRDLEGRILKYQ